MGVFDYVRCRARLPGTPPAFVDASHEFQTKSFDDPWLERYEITEAGVLMGPDGEIVSHDGEVEFYTSNVVGLAGGAYYTEAGEDAETVRYVATFDGGLLQGIRETERSREPARAAAELRRS